MKKVIIQFITIVIFSLIFGGFGLFLGIFIGNTFNFPLLWGMRGYESGGVFFVLIGITVGVWLVFSRLQKNLTKGQK